VLVLILGALQNGEAGAPLKQVSPALRVDMSNKLQIINLSDLTPRNMNNILRNATCWILYPNTSKTGQFVNKSKPI